MSLKRKYMLFLLIFITVLSTSGCRKSTKPSIVIAEQFGLAYAPLQIIRLKGTIERLMPEADVSWVRLGNTAAIREAVIAGKVDAGFMAIPPFLIARERGMDWKIFSGLSRTDVCLVVDTRKSKTLDSLRDDKRIALPQPGSIQHILLSMAAGKHFGDSSVFDDQLVTMKHPDGMNALISGNVDAHFTSPPFIYQETETAEEGNYPYKVILTDEEAFGGEFTFIVGMTTGEFADQNPELVEILRTALKEGMDLLSSKPDEAAGLLSESYGIGEEKLLEYLEKPGNVYTTEVQGLDTFIDFMSESGYLENPVSVEEVILK